MFNMYVYKTLILFELAEHGARCINNVFMTKKLQRSAIEIKVL